MEGLELLPETESINTSAAIKRKSSDHRRSFFLLRRTHSANVKWVSNVFYYLPLILRSNLNALECLFVSLDFFYVILKVEGKSPVQLKAKEKTEIEN
jgi:hypothetical protein